MTHGSLFSGIGGIDLGFEMAGIKTSWTCEIDDWCNEILEKRFPDATKYKDIKDIGKHNLQPVDIISGGFPCQDISQAGKGQGLKGARSILWFEMWRIISELQPRWVLIENVPALTYRGGTRVLHDLAEIGYDAEWQIISARDVGARHLRKRIWIIAYLSNTKSSRYRGGGSKECGDKRKGKFQQEEQKGSAIRSETEGCDNAPGERKAILSNPSSIGSKYAPKSIEEGSKDSSRKEYLQGNETSKLSGNVSKKVGEGKKRISKGKNKEIGELKIQTFERLKNEPRLDRVAYGLSNKVDRYKERVKGLGNAVVPQIPYLIGRRLIKLNKIMEA
jgi:DNA (cytosine-5)-methyltransferase 1